MNTQFTRFTGCALCVLIVAALLMACQPIRPEGVAAQAAAPSAEEQFMTTILAHEEAYQNEDWEAFVNFYAEDAISHAPGFPADKGKAAIATAVQGLFTAYDLERTFQVADFEIHGDFATRTGEWTQILTPTDGGEPITEVGRCILGWQKIDGEWKVIWEIWNTYDPQPQ